MTDREVLEKILEQMEQQTKLLRSIEDWLVIINAGI